MPVPRITKEDLRAKLEAEPASARPVIIDARLKYPFEHSALRLPGALRLRLYPIDTSAMSRDREIVLYDSDPDEVEATRVAADLIRQGYRALALKGGFGEWAGASFPVEARTTPPVTSV